MKWVSFGLFVVGMLVCIGFFAYNIFYNLTIDLGIGLLVISQLAMFTAIYIGLVQKEEKK